MSRLSNLTAIVLRKRDFMESDMILTVLDSEGHRREVIVKGAGSQKSRRRRHLERMNLIKGSLYKGKTHFYLQDVQCQSSYTSIKDDLDMIMQASVLLELADRSIMAEDPHPEIFKLMLATLEEMNKKNLEVPTLDMSLVQLAHNLGFLPNFKECSQCHNEVLDDTLHWDRQNGTLHCKNCGNGNTPLPLKYRKAMEFFRQHHVSSASQLKLQKEEATELRSLVFDLFQSHLQSPLKTLSLN